MNFFQMHYVLFITTPLSWCSFTKDNSIVMKLITLHKSLCTVPDIILPHISQDIHHQKKKFPIEVDCEIGIAGLQWDVLWGNWISCIWAFYKTVALINKKIKFSWQFSLYTPNTHFHSNGHSVYHYFLSFWRCHFYQKHICQFQHIKQNLSTK